MRTFTTPTCSALSVFLLLAASASGETRYVSSEGSAESPFISWKTAARDIASALDVAHDDDQIIVAPGTYPIGRTIVVNRAVTLRSAAGARKTVLDGQGSPRDGWCFDVQSARAIVDGFTITSFGGGVRFRHREGTTAVVRNCVIVRNAGHGIFFNHGGCAKNCTVAYNGGPGLYAYDMGGGGDDPANLILFGNEQGFIRQSANISLHNSCTDDPHFVSDKDFRLRPESPCIDAGRNENWMIDAVDAAGRPRIRNKVVDVGAYEFEALIRAATGENEAAERANAAVDIQRVEAREFNELSVQFGGIWIWWEKAKFTVKGDGAVEFSMNKAPDDDSRYTAKFRLSPKHLSQLVQLLKKTGWLTAAGANEQPGYTDATRIDMKLVRAGKGQEAWCHDRNPEPYLSLVNFLKRIQRQEYLLNRAVDVGQKERGFAFREIDQGIRSAEGDSVAAPAYSPLDYNRFLPVSMDVILHPDENHEDTVVTALRVLAMLKTQKARQQITHLTTAKQVGRAPVSPEHRMGVIGSASVKALTVLGGPQARQHVRDMAKDHGSWERRVNEALVESLLALDRDGCAESLKDMVSSTREAAWGLIRLGPDGVPEILELLEQRDRRNMGQIYLIREYIDHWEVLPGPIDDRVIEAVRKNLDFRLGSSRDWTEYHKELLELADAPGLPVSCPRQIAEAFLAALKEDDRATLGAVSLADQNDWSEWHAKLRELPEFQKLVITEVYADKDDNMALATAVNPNGGESGRLAIYLNFLSGTVWRVRTLFIHTGEEPEKADRVFKRFLEKYPDAKLVPRNAADRPAIEPDGQIGREPTVRDKLAAPEAALTWLKLVDSREDARSLSEAALCIDDRCLGYSFCRALWQQWLSIHRVPLGQVITRKTKSTKNCTKPPSAPNGEYLAIEFETSFENKRGVAEIVTLRWEATNTWRVSNYSIAGERVDSTKLPLYNPPVGWPEFDLNQIEIDVGGVTADDSVTAAPGSSESVPSWVSDPISRQVARICAKAVELSEVERKQSAQYLDGLSDQELAKLYGRVATQAGLPFDAALRMVMKDRRKIVEDMTKWGYRYLSDEHKRDIEMRREELVAELADVGPQAVEPLARYVSADRRTYGQKKFVTEALRKMGPRAVESMIRLMDSPNDRVRVFFVHVLSRSDDARAKAAFLCAMDDENPSVREDALLGLVLLGPNVVGSEKLLATLIAALEDEPCLKLAIEGLKKYGDETAIESLAVIERFHGEMSKGRTRYFAVCAREAINDILRRASKPVEELAREQYTDRPTYNDLQQAAVCPNAAIRLWAIRRMGWDKDRREQTARFLVGRAHVERNPKVIEQVKLTLRNFLSASGDASDDDGSLPKTIQSALDSLR